MSVLSSNFDRFDEEDIATIAVDGKLVIYESVVLLGR